MSPDVLSRLRDADPCPSPVAYDDDLVQRHVDAITRADLTVGGPASAPPPRRPSRLAVAALVAALVVVGSIVGVEVARDGGSSPSVANGPNGVVRSSGLAPTPSGRVPGPAGSPWSTFSWNGVSFEHPSRWTSYRYESVSTGSVLYTYLSTSPVPDPCVTSTAKASRGTVSCGPDLPDLHGSGVFVDWTSFGLPGTTVGSFPGAAATIAGREARVQRGAVPPECTSSGAVSGAEAAVSVGGSNVLTMTACIGAGEDVAADLAAVDRMLASLRITS